ncbi:winged helix-turn-helix domain-containing protein [Sinosporangium album]|nr:winged helix-turn-helix domain-containing protein [Sinosporangium album]
METLNREALSDRPHVLSATQMSEISSVLTGDPREYGIACALWTLAVVRDLIAARYGVRLDRYGIPGLLRLLGLWPANPRHWGAGIDPEVLAQWRRHRYSELRRQAHDAGGTLWFADIIPLPSGVTVVTASTPMGPSVFAAYRDTPVTDAFPDFCRRLADSGSPWLMMTPHPVLSARPVARLRAEGTVRMHIVPRTLDAAVSAAERWRAARRTALRTKHTRADLLRALHAAGAREVTTLCRAAGLARVTADEVLRGAVLHPETLDPWRTLLDELTAVTRRLDEAADERERLVAACWKAGVSSVGLLSRTGGLPRARVERVASALPEVAAERERLLARLALAAERGEQPRDELAVACWSAGVSTSVVVHTGRLGKPRLARAVKTYGEGVARERERLLAALGEAATAVRQSTLVRDRLLRRAHAVLARVAARAEACQRAEERARERRNELIAHCWRAGIRTISLIERRTHLHQSVTYGALRASGIDPPMLRR